MKTNIQSIIQIIESEKAFNHAFENFITTPKKVYMMDCHHEYFGNGMLVIFDKHIDIETCLINSVFCNTILMDKWTDDCICSMEYNLKMLNTIDEKLMKLYKKDISNFYQNTKIIPSDEKAFREAFRYRLDGMKEILKSMSNDIGSNCIGFYENFSPIEEWLEFDPLSKFSELTHVSKIRDEHSYFREEFLAESQQAYIYYSF